MESKKYHKPVNITKKEDFPGAVVKNPPANAGDPGLILGPRRSHCHRAPKPVHHNC